MQVITEFLGLALSHSMDFIDDRITPHNLYSSTCSGGVQITGGSYPDVRQINSRTATCLARRARGPDAVNPPWRRANCGAARGGLRRSLFRIRARVATATAIETAFAWVAPA
jgi:hypothetical protein